MSRNNEEERLDALLNSDAQRAVRNAVRGLPEESLSLSWRSSLNEKLLQVRPIPKWRIRLAATWKPVAGLALAGCLAMMITLRTTEPPIRHSSSLEASLVSVYDEQANSDEVAGSGLAFHEVSDTTRTNDSSSDWSESDLTNL